MTQNEIDERVNTLMKAFDEINAFFITKIALQVAKIGELTPSSASTITVMAQMNVDMAAINAKLSQARRITVPGLHRL